VFRIGSEIALSKEGRAIEIGISSADVAVVVLFLGAPLATLLHNCFLVNILGIVRRFQLQWFRQQIELFIFNLGYLHISVTTYFQLLRPLQKKKFFIIYIATQREAKLTS
jgi:hypothetical protein